jgi:hypothetical protein
LKICITKVLIGGGHLKLTDFDDDPNINYKVILLRVISYLQHFILNFLTLKWAKKARVFEPGRPFQPSLMFVGKARGLP